MLEKIAAYFVSLILSKVESSKRFFQLLEKRGFHATKVHYYEPIPDTRTLKDSLWKSKSELVGIDINTEEQLRLLTSVFPNFKEEYAFPRNKTEIPYEYYLDNHFFPSVDAEVLHSMIRHFKPRKIIEVGSGFSTYVSAQAANLSRISVSVTSELPRILIV